MKRPDSMGNNAEWGCFAKIFLQCLSSENVILQKFSITLRICEGLTPQLVWWLLRSNRTVVIVTTRMAYWKMNREFCCDMKTLINRLSFKKVCFERIINILPLYSNRLVLVFLSWLSLVRLHWKTALHTQSTSYNLFILYHHLPSRKPCFEPYSNFITFYPNFSLIALENSDH